MNNDFENMYFSQKELAKLYAKFDEVIAIGYFKQALSSAQKLNDDFKLFKNSGQKTIALLIFSLANSLNVAAIKYDLPLPKFPHKYNPFWCLSFL